MRTTGRLIGTLLIACLFAGSPARAGGDSCEFCKQANDHLDDLETYTLGHVDHREWTIIVPPLPGGRHMNCFWKSNEAGKSLRHSMADGAVMSAAGMDSIQFTSSGPHCRVIFKGLVWPFVQTSDDHVIDIPAGGCSRFYRLRGDLGATPKTPKSFSIETQVEEAGKWTPLAPGQARSPSDNTEVSPVVVADG